MKKNLIFCSLLALAGLMSCGNNNKEGNAQENPGTEQEITDAKSNIASKEEYKIEDGRIKPVNGKPMIVDFTASWCPPCKQLKPIFAEVKEEFKDKIDFIAIDVDSFPELAQKYDVQNIPNIVYLDPEGVISGRQIGFQTKDELIGGITAYFGK